MFKRSFFALFFLFWVPALAQNATPGQTEGPATITLGSNLAELKLPKGYIFFDKATTAKMLQDAGNPGDGSELGTVISAENPDSFFVLIRYEAMGYVKDDEADKIDAAELLQSYKDGTEARNEERAKAGAPALHVEGWGEEPHYDAKLHHLIWALTAKSGNESVVNFETRVLGREGVMSMTLICDPKDLAAAKPQMSSLLANTTYKEGKRYSDFKEGDKVSEAGLLALVAGGAAAAKLGLFAKLLKGLLWLLVIFKKGFIFIVMGAVALFNKLRGKSSAPEPLPASPPSSPPSAEDQQV